MLEEYMQFIVPAVIVLVGALAYFLYINYMNKDKNITHEIKDVPNQTQGPSPTGQQMKQMQQMQQMRQQQGQGQRPQGQPQQQQQQRPQGQPQQGQRPQGQPQQGQRPQGPRGQQPTQGPP